MNILAFGKKTKGSDYTILSNFILQVSKEHNFFIYDKYYEAIQGQLSDESLAAKIHIVDDETITGDMLVCLGGDGTILDAVKFLKSHSMPILGVNTGRLGFLSTISQNLILETMEYVLSGNWQTERRKLIELELSDRTFNQFDNIGLNEVTIHKSNSNEMIVIHAYMNGEFLNTYWCDGLIISTPTGSTAYSLACGGPIITPNTSCLVVTPIAPHSLTVRPMIIPDSTLLTFEVESRSGEALVAVDNRTTVIKNHSIISVKISKHIAEFVTTKGYSYFDILRKKLNWGLDNRNNS
jgi:NAD+ kinase